MAALLSLNNHIWFLRSNNWSLDNVWLPVTKDVELYPLHVWFKSRNLSWNLSKPNEKIICSVLANTMRSLQSMHGYYIYVLGLFSSHMSLSDNNKAINLQLRRINFDKLYIHVVRILNCNKESTEQNNSIRDPHSNVVHMQIILKCTYRHA